ncbi:unnamed protein product, partial [Rotaria sordida]
EEEEEEEEEEEKEDIDTFLSNLWLKLNNAKSNKDDLDEILMQLQDIQNQIIVYFKEAASECNVEELKIYENKLLKIKWYADITTMYMINNLSSHQRNHLNFHHRNLTVREDGCVVEQIHLNNLSQEENQDLDCENDLNVSY